MNRFSNKDSKKNKLNRTKICTLSTKNSLFSCMMMLFDMFIVLLPNACYYSANPTPIRTNDTILLSNDAGSKAEGE